MKTFLLASAGLVLAGAPLSARPGPVAAAPEGQQVYKMKLGRFTVVAIGDGVFQLATDQLLVDAKPGEAAALLAAQHLPTIQPTSVNAFLIDTGSKRVLIDTGGGSFFGPSMGKFLGNLAAAGYAPEDIDEVLITHLHADHIGALSADGKATFPNAVVRMSAPERAFWQDKGHAAQVDASVKGTFDASAAMLAPYAAAGRVRPFTPGATIAPGITAVALAGHTPGHSAYRIASGGKTMLVWGDTMHVAPVQLVDPAITIKFDWMPERARASRVAIMGEAAARHEWVAGAHLPFPGIGTLAKGATQWRWTPVSGEPAR